MFKAFCDVCQQPAMAGLPTAQIAIPVDGAASGASLGPKLVVGLSVKIKDAGAHICARCVRAGVHKILDKLPEDTNTG